MPDTYAFMHLRHAGDPDGLRHVLRENVLAGWRAAGIVPWGIWGGLFGVASDEQIVVAAAHGDVSEAAFAAPVEATALEVRRFALLEPTARPLARAPRERPGLYVFRFFTVLPESIDEFVDLSTAAWTTFENAADYAAEPQGLFRPKRAAAAAQDMLLVTWYDSLTSWATSREPDPAARERFARRRELTSSTVAYATRLQSA